MLLYQFLYREPPGTTDDERMICIFDMVQEQSNFPGYNWEPGYSITVAIAPFDIHNVIEYIVTVHSKPETDG